MILNDVSEVLAHNKELKEIADKQRSSWKTISEPIDNTEVLPKGRTLYNAGESSDNVIIKDGVVVDDIIDMWEEITNETCISCINENCASNTDEGARDIVGAHVVEEPGNMKPGKMAYIIPLCKTCNNQKDLRFRIILNKAMQAVPLKTIDRNILSY